MKRYKYIRHIVDKLINSDSNNEEFTLYNHLVGKQSGMGGFFAATIYSGTDRYSGEVADFSYDYWTHSLYIEDAESRQAADAIISAFKSIYPCYLKIIDDTQKEVI